MEQTIPIGQTPTKETSPQKFSEWISGRPSADRNLDQFYATIPTVVSRVKLLGQWLAPQASIIFLSGDDLTSLALAVSRPDLRITVVDIDPRIIDHIRLIAGRERLQINCVQHDLRQPIPKDVGPDHSAVFFDPPYTPIAVRVWLQRALEATLGRGSNWKRKQPEQLSSHEYIMCYGYTDRSSERGLAIQAILTENGFVIHEKQRGFNRYLGAKSIGSSSDLYRLRATPKVHIQKVDIVRSSFYTGQKQR